MLLEDLAPIAQSIAQFIERKGTEAVLVQIAEQRRLALDSAQMGWWHLDLRTNQVQCDERFKMIFGTSQEELALDKGLGMIHPEDRTGVEAAITAATHPQRPAPVRRSSAAWSTPTGGCTGSRSGARRTSRGKGRPAGPSTSSAPSSTLRRL